MSQINQFKVVNNITDKGIKFHFATGYQDSITVNTIALTSPGQTADQNFGANFGGFTRLINIDFVLRNDGSDKSVTGDNIITLSEQIDYLMETVLQGKGASAGDSFADVDFTVTVYRDSSSKTYVGTLEDVAVNPDTTNGVQVAGNLRLRQGGVS